MTNLMNLRMLYEMKKITSDDYETQLIERTADIYEMEKDFKFRDFLGRGSYGVVISATSPDYDHEVAVKFTRSEHTKDEEIDVWPSLHHPNILPVYEVNCLQHVTIFITPRLSCDLETALSEEDIRQKSSGFDTARSWLKQTLEAIHFLHMNKLCHCDIKADNVLIDYDSTAKLSDFSFLQKADNIFKRVGAPLLYRPPLSENETVDGYTFDIWCLGIMALNVLTQHSMLTDINEIERKAFCWHKDVYPAMLKHLQMKNFRASMSAAFPASNLEEKDFTEALDFIHFLLRIEAKNRPSAKEALDHVFLKEGKVRFEKPDSLWVVNDQDQSADSLSCSVLYFNAEKTMRQKKRRLHRYKFRHIVTVKPKHMRWMKSSKNGFNDLTSHNFDLNDAVPMNCFDNLFEMKNKVPIKCSDHGDLKIIIDKDEMICDKEACFANMKHLELLYENEANEKTEKSEEEDQQRIVKSGKSISRVNLRIDAMQADKDSPNMTNKRSFERNYCCDSTYYYPKDIPKACDNTKKQSFKKESKFRKFCSWLQDKCTQLCICGSITKSKK